MVKGSKKTERIFHMTGNGNLFSIKDSIVNILGFMSHKVSITQLLTPHCTRKAAINNT